MSWQGWQGPAGKATRLTWLLGVDKTGKPERVFIAKKLDTVDDFEKTYYQTIIL